jgi:flagellar basal-body rod modification protein FlgD
MPEVNFQPIVPAAPTNAGPAVNTVAGGSSILGTLGSDAFLKLFVAQLKYQNPMEPMDSSQMLQQTSQFTEIETLQQLATAQRTTMGYQQMATATALIGKSVTALDGTEHVTGIVDRVQVSSSGPILVMGIRQIPLTEVTSVGIPTPAPTAAAVSPTPAPTAAEISPTPAPTAGP